MIGTVPCVDPEKDVIIPTIKVTPRYLWSNRDSPRNIAERELDMTVRPFKQPPPLFQTEPCSRGAKFCEARSMFQMSELIQNLASYCLTGVRP